MAGMIPGMKGRLTIGDVDMSGGKIAAKGNVLQKLTAPGLEMYIRRYEFEVEAESEGKSESRLAIDENADVNALVGRGRTRGTNEGPINRFNRN